MFGGRSSAASSRAIMAVAVCFPLIWAAGTFSQAQTLTLSSSSVTGNCFAVDVTTSGFSSFQFEDLQFIVFVVDATTGESAHAVAPPTPELSSENLTIYPAVNESSGDVNVTGCLSTFTCAANLKLILALRNTTASEAAAITATLPDPAY